MHKKIQTLTTKFWQNIATLGPIGFQKAPGTWASIVSFPFLLFFSWNQAWPQRFICALFTFLIALIASHFYLKSSQKAGDPSEVVIDEVAGMAVLFVWPLGDFLENSSFERGLFGLIGLALFRLFDIWKPAFIGWSDRHIKGAFGIVFDDVLAGALAGLGFNFLVLLGRVI